MSASKESLGAGSSLLGEEEQIDDGFVLTCVAYPTSDNVTLLAEQEEMLFE